VFDPLRQQLLWVKLHIDREIIIIIITQMNAKKTLAPPKEQHKREHK
jgi:hypothetical protein